MKKLFYSLFALVFAMAFTSCEDVPAPYYDPSEGGGSIISPLGQGTEEDPFNVAGAYKYIADGNDGDAIVYVRGIIVSVSEVDIKQYGNATYTISDDGTAKNVLQVYRGLALGNRKFISENEIKPGDEVIICGKLVSRNGEYEFTQGNYIYYLNGESAAGMGEISGTGTLEDPYTPGAANLFCKTLESDVVTDKEYYIKGKISRIANKGTYTDGGTYGNASFYISDSGEATGEFYCFRVLYLKNTKYNEYTGTKTDIKVGDEVIVCAKLVLYQGTTPETSAGNGYMYSHNGNTGDGGSGGGTAKGDGTLNNPYNPLGAAQAVSGLTWTSNTEYDKTDNVYVKGKISRIANKGTYTDGGTYGNASFYISEDGTESGEFYCFRVLYLNNTKYNEYTGEKVDIKVGDEVVIYGKLMNYRGNTPETVAGEAHLYSLNSGGGGGGGTTDGGFTRSVDESNYVVFFTDNNTTAGNQILTYDLTQNELAHQAENPSFTLNGASITFAKGDGSTTPKYWKTGDFNEFRMYAKNTLTITPPSGKIHSIALQCSATYGSTNYMGNAQATATVANGVITITNEWTGTSGGTQLRIKQIQIQYTQ
ncbi:MAG: hypothetical protein II950_01015 [Prevotella sp.]|nr:hypothetical protein [Prevotella sp.]